jgi:heme/copper-type cytochrome/quinol oxidase subunit 2
MISSVLILATELLVGVAIGSMIGMERFNQIMNYDITKDTVQEATLRSVCGIPMNVIFASVALIVYYFVKKHRAKKSASANSEQSE